MTRFDGIKVIASNKTPRPSDRPGQREGRESAGAVSGEAGAAEESFYNTPAIVTGHLAGIILTYWQEGFPATPHGAMRASPRLKPEIVLEHWDVAHNAAKFIAASLKLPIPKTPCSMGPRG